jgi:biopolymer transport protein ExbB
MDSPIITKSLSTFHALGFAAYPLAICFVLMATIIVERTYFLIFLTRSVNLKLDPSKISKRNNVLYSLVHELLAIKNLPKSKRDEIMNISFVAVRRHLKIGLGMLKFIAAIAPMFGILGNVLGMLDSFSMISQGNGSINPSMVSKGLKEAMYATSAGLLVAIPAMFFEYYFGYLASSRLDNYISYVNRLNIKIEISSSSHHVISNKNDKSHHNDTHEDRDTFFRDENRRSSHKSPGSGGLSSKIKIEDEEV